MYLKEIGVSMKNWIDLTQDGDYWGAFLSYIGCNQ